MTFPGAGNVDQTEAAVEIFNGEGPAPFLIVCEHASNFIPDGYARLGLDGAGQAAHVAWDPGALKVAQRISDVLDAPLVASRMSRLLHDCNRPAASPQAMPAKSENWIIPGNAGLTPRERNERAEHIYFPFHRAVAAQLDRWNGASALLALVTIHTFTPVYFGVPREVEIGILYDADSRLADFMLAQQEDGKSARIVRRNEPYAPVDGVTHTLQVHALPRGLPNVMIEVRNDLVETQEEQDAMGDWLAGEIRMAAGRLAAAHTGTPQAAGALS